MCASDENDWFTKENFINRNVEYVNISYVFKTGNLSFMSLKLSL